jgi:sulfopyruvate decarboxylase subunit alpha
MKADAAKAAHEAIIKAGINFIACLPDSAFQELYIPLSADPRLKYLQVASENDGVGLCMGAWLGGLKPALLVENTGFTLGTYALMRGPVAFGVPMLLLISHRGELGDERWFSAPFGWGTKPLLDSMRITHRSVDKTAEVEGVILSAAKSMNSLQAPVAILFSTELLF